MKKIIVLICIVISFGFGKFESDDFFLSVVKIDKSNPEDVRIVLKLKNNTNRKINFLTNSCAVNNFFETNDPQVVLIDNLCNKKKPNVLELTLEPKSGMRFKLKINFKESQQSSFKLAFKLFEIQEVIKLDEKNQMKLKPKYIWTDEIKM